MTQQVVLSDVAEFRRKVEIVFSRAGLKDLDHSRTPAAALVEPDRAGLWTWDSGVPVAVHQDDPDENQYIAPDPAEVGAWRRPVTTSAGGGGGGGSTGSVVVNSRTALRQVDYSVSPVVFLTEAGRQSVWVWDGGVTVAQHQADAGQTIFVAPSNGVTGAFRNVTPDKAFTTIVTTRAAMKALPTTTNGVMLVDSRGASVWRWNASVDPAVHRADTSETTYVAPNTTSFGAWVNQLVQSFAWTSYSPAVVTSGTGTPSFSVIEARYILEPDGWVQMEVLVEKVSGTSTGILKVATPTPVTQNTVVNAVVIDSFRSVCAAEAQTSNTTGPNIGSCVQVNAADGTGLLTGSSNKRIRISARYR